MWLEIRRKDWKSKSVTKTFDNGPSLEKSTFLADAEGSKPGYASITASQIGRLEMCRKHTREVDDQKPWLLLQFPHHRPPFEHKMLTAELFVLFRKQQQTFNLLDPSSSLPSTTR